MSKLARLILAAIVVSLLAAPRPAAADARIALVVGNGDYARGPVSNAQADAGLVAEALTTVGFEVIEGADLDQADLRRTFRDFLSRLEAAGPDTVAFVYFSGYALEFEGENYLVPMDARLARDSDIPLEGVRVSDLIHALAGVNARAKVVALDASRPLPVTLPVAPGLAAVEAPPGMLVAYATAPGTFAEDGGSAYGPYASAVAEMLRRPQQGLTAMFTRIRLRTHALTEGRQTPWHVAALTEDVVLLPGDAAGLDRAPAAMAVPAIDDVAPPALGGDVAPPALGGDIAPPAMGADLSPLRDAGPDQGYGLAVQQDTLPAYEAYLDAYPTSIYAPQIWVIVRTRREALFWSRAVRHDSREAYWTYLHHYPDGIYANDARRRLRRLAADAEPPPGFAPIDFAGMPPPLAREPRNPPMGAPRPQAVVPRNLIAPPPAYLANLPPPRPAAGPRLLPPAVGLPVIRHPAEPPQRYGPPVRVNLPGRQGYPPPAREPANPGQPLAIEPGRTPDAAGQSGVPLRPGLPPGIRELPPRPPSLVTPISPIAPLGPGPAQVPGTQVPARLPPAPPPVYVAPPPPPAMVARPVPPVVHPPPVVVHPVNPQPPIQGRGGPVGRKCTVINGVERCF